MASESPRLGFIGMGGMGSRMAARLLAAGYDVTIYNRNRERTRALEKLGAAVAAQPGELRRARRHHPLLPRRRRRG